MLTTILAVVVCVVVLLAVIIKVFFSIEGDPEVVVDTKNRTKFTVTKRDDKSVTLTSKVEFKNIGKQCSTIVDCLVRPQLPFEQYDGIDARAKAEVDGVPREDDYFEAYLIEKHKSIFINVIVRLAARKGMDIDTALSHMVDLPLDIITTQLGRKPWWMSKDRMILTAEEISEATGVKLAKE